MHVGHRALEKDGEVWILAVKICMQRQRTACHMVIVTCTGLRSGF